MTTGASNQVIARRDGSLQKGHLLLHRFDITDFASEQPSAKTRKLFAEAETKLDEIVSLLRQGRCSRRAGSIVAPDQELDLSASRLRAQRYERNIGGGQEEFIEAISFYHYLRTTQLITLRQIQHRFRTEPVSKSQLYTDPAQTTTSSTTAAQHRKTPKSSMFPHIDICSASPT